MHTVELRNLALVLLGQLGYQTREEWLGGSGGGLCELGDQKVVFVDLDLPVRDQLEHLVDVLRQEPAAAKLALPATLSAMLHTPQDHAA